jgi:ABC-2 type transport system permease protein
MILSLVFIGLVVILEAGPVYAVFMAGAQGRVAGSLAWTWLGGTLALVAALCAAAVFLPMRAGIARLSRT